ncbi:MAG: hypothetical protein ABI386_13420 [Rhodanobacter sp.]
MDIVNATDVEAAKQTLVKLMAIADRLDARNLKTAQQLEAAVTALDHGASRLGQGADAFAQRALQLIGTGAQQSIVQGTEQAAAQVRHQLKHTVDSAQAAAQAMEREARLLTGARRSLLWNGLIALLVGALLAAGGAAWIAQKSMQEVAQAHFAKDILEATHTGAITRCGERLCVRVGKTPQRYGAKGEYVLLR